jgi:Domain of unknown function (DUF4252)
MKTISIYFFSILLSMPCIAQHKAIDNIFSNFDGKEGITTVNISKDLLNNASQLDTNNFKFRDLFSHISGLKVLAFEKASSEDKAAFETMVKSLPLNDYKELMAVKEANQNIKMLIKEQQGKISEFLLLVTGGNDPVMVSIIGDIDLKQLEKLSGSMKIDGLEHLAKLNNKK